MRTDSRLSRVLHALLHMQHAGRPLTSDEIAGMLQTNPVVVRRLLAGLRDSGYVQSEKGHGGGWMLSVALDDITLLDIYKSVGAPRLIPEFVSEDEPGCLVEQAVNARLSSNVYEAEQALLASFDKVTLGELSRDIEATGMKMHPSR